MKRSLYIPVFVSMTLPWLNPFASGPSPSVAPWLFSMVCAVVAILLGLQASMQTSAVAPLSLDLKQAVAASLLVAGLVSSVLALVQYFDVAARFVPWVNQTGPGQAFANLRQRNQFATLTNLALAAFLWLHVQAKVQPQRKRHLPTAAAKIAVRFLPLMAVSLLTVGNAISSSRTGMVQLLLVCSMYAAWNGLGNRGIRRLLSCAVLVYILAAFAMPYLAGLDLSTYGTFARLGQDDACGSRLVLWSNVLHLIAQKPLLGWGWGELDYAHFITLYNEPRFCDILDNAHNLPLHFAVELGVPAALLVCGGFAWWVVRQKPWAERDATRQMAWAVLAVILLHSMVEYPLWYGPFQMAFGICIILLWRQKPPAEDRNSPNNASSWPLAHILRAQAAIILMAFIAYAAWDYHRISQIYLEPESRSAVYRTDTLNKIRGSWLFADQVQFAELLTTPLTPANAEWTLNTAKQLLHYSPEPRVVEKLIESAVLLGEEDDALAYLVRYKAAFPKEHTLWAKRNSTPL